jgi:hypothetical protein
MAISAIFLLFCLPTKNAPILCEEVGALFFITGGYKKLTWNMPNPSAVAEMAADFGND